MTSPYSVFQSIYDWNQQARLLNNAYSDTLESGFQIEEALEGFSDLSELTACFSHISDAHPDSGPRELSQIIMKLLQNQGDEISDVDRFDKHVDGIIYHFGSLFKLGLTPTSVLEGIAVVMDANQQKLKSKRSASDGKLLKSADFVGPEPELQAILDCRE